MHHYSKRQFQSSLYPMCAFPIDASGRRKRKRNGDGLGVDAKLWKKKRKRHVRRRRSRESLHREGCRRGGAIDIMAAAAPLVTEVENRRRNRTASSIIRRRPLTFPRLTSLTPHTKEINETSRTINLLHHSHNSSNSNSSNNRRSRRPRPSSLTRSRQFLTLKGEQVI